MPTLLEKFEAAAEARLVVPPGRTVVEELARFRAFLKVESTRIRMLHRAGGGGREVARARSGLLDVLMRRLWTAAAGTMSSQAQREFPPMALVAIGGYGRGELNPFSDIDFMVLHDGQVVGGAKALPHLSRMMDGLLLPLFDLKFKLGHSARTVSDCVQVANLDMQSKTSLIEARLVAGDARLFEKFEKALLRKCVEGHENEYIAARREDQARRHEKFGETAAMQEPNLKNGCGGLRDFQNLHWMTFFKHRTRTLAEMQERDFISAAERKQLDQAYDFLLRVRTELHYQCDRAADVLQKSHQPTVAHYLGYGDRSPSRRLERFMRDLYLAMRSIYLITRTLEERLALSPEPSRLQAVGRLIPAPFRKAPEQPMDGFRFSGGQIHAANPRVFHDQPRRLMRVFLYAQQRGLKLHPDVAQMIRRGLALVNRGFLHDGHVRATFLEILTQRGNVAPILRAMHEVGLLGKYMPEFGRLTCLVQHEFYHIYAADEHTLQCVAQLDTLCNAPAGPLDRYRDVAQKLEQPFLLYLALLLHDSGKPEHDGAHARAGAQLALRVARRLNLDGATAHALRLLVEHHLLMAHVSQRRDLEDQGVVRQFAGTIQSPENLRMLTLLTYADTLATSDKLWNGFKDSLLWQLHHKAMNVLLGGTDFIRAEETQRELLAEEVARLAPRTFGRDEIQGHFDNLPARYFQIHTAKEIVADVSRAHRFMHHQLAAANQALDPVFDWHNEPDRGFSSVKISTWDRAGLFSKIAGSLSAAGINILSAQVFTRADGIVLDTFFVTDARTGGLVPPAAREKFESFLLRALTEDLDLHPLLAKQSAVRPLYQPVAGGQLPTRIHFDNDSSEARTILEIETEDRVGLLYAISQALTECRLDISVAKITTEKGAAIDAFYVAEADGQKVTEAGRQVFIKQQLQNAIGSLAKGG